MTSIGVRPQEECDNSRGEIGGGVLLQLEWGVYLKRVFCLRELIQRILTTNGVRSQVHCDYKSSVNQRRV